MCRSPHRREKGERPACLRERSDRVCGPHSLLESLRSLLQCGDEGRLYRIGERPAQTVLVPFAKTKGLARAAGEST